MFLAFPRKKGADIIKKLLNSAISNAENNENADIDNLRIKSIIVNKGFCHEEDKDKSKRTC